MENIYEELPKTAVIYARKNYNYNNDVRSQINKCKDYAEKNKMEIVKVFVESGNNDEGVYMEKENKILDEAILFSVRNSIDYFLVDRPELMSEGTVTFLERKGDLESNHITVLFASYDHSYPYRSYDNAIPIENRKFEKEQVIKKMTLDSIKVRCLCKSKKLKGEI